MHSNKNTELNYALLKSFWPNSENMFTYTAICSDKATKRHSFSMRDGRLRPQRPKRPLVMWLFSLITVSLALVWFPCMLFNLTPTIHYIFKSLGSVVPTDFDSTEKYYGSQWGASNVWLHTFFKIYSLVFRKRKVWNNLRFNKLWHHFWLNYHLTTNV